MMRNDKDRKLINSDLSRYMNNEMTERERYDYERQLQKDPFESDALEGLQSVSPEEIVRDMGNIRKRLSKVIRPVGLSKLLRIAAVVVILVGVSSLFLVRELRRPDLLLSENVEMGEQEAVVGRVADPEMDLTEREESGKKAGPEVKLAEPVDEIISVSEAAEKEISDDKVSDRKGEVVAGVNIVSAEEVADEAELKYVAGENLAKAELAEEVVVEKMAMEEMVVAEEAIVSAPQSKSARRAAEPAALMLEEDAMAGYDIEEEAIADKADTVSGYVTPEPEGGLNAYKDYLKDKQLFPASWDQSGREVVRLKFRVGIDSVITNIEILKSPDDLFSNEAIRLINEGPVWNPATRNGVAVMDSVRLRIVFRRQ